MLDVPSEENFDLSTSAMNKYVNTDLKEVKFENEANNTMQSDDGIHSNMSLPIGINTSRFNSKKSSVPNSRLELLKELR